MSIVSISLSCNQNKCKNVNLFSVTMETDAKTVSSLLKDKEAPEYMREISITTGYRQRLSYKGCVVRFVKPFLNCKQYWTTIIDL